MDRRPASFASTTVAILAFGVAFGYLEATVVVYLRAALGLAPAGLVPVHDPAAFGTCERVVRSPSARRGRSPGPLAGASSS